MHIELSTFQETEKAHLYQLLLVYFEEIDPSKILFSDGKKSLHYPFLDAYWNEENRLPLKIIYHTEVAGFVLINDHVIDQMYKAEKSIAEFYIKPEFRQKGMGRAVAYSLFRQYRCKWEVKQSTENLLATAFWRAVIGAFTKGAYTEIKVGSADILQLFSTK